MNPFEERTPNVEPLYVEELMDAEGDILWGVSFKGTSILTTHDRRQLQSILDTMNRPVKWLVPDQLCVA